MNNSSAVIFRAMRPVRHLVVFLFFFFSFYSSPPGRQEFPPTANTAWTSDKIMWSFFCVAYGILLCCRYTRDEEKPVFFLPSVNNGRKLWNLQDVVVVVYIYFSEIRFAMHTLPLHYTLATRIDNTTSWRAMATVVFVARSFISFLFSWRLEIDYDVDNNNYYYHNIIILTTTTTTTEKTSRTPITIRLVPIAKIQEN